MRAEPVFLRVVAARDRLDIKIMRALMAAFVEEIGGESEMGWIASDMVQLDEGELDLGMPAIAAFLAGAAAESRGDVVDIATENVEQPAPAGRLEIGDRALDHMAGAIE